MVWTAAGLDVSCRCVDFPWIVPVPAHDVAGLIAGEAVVMDDVVDQVVLAILVGQLRRCHFRSSGDNDPPMQLERKEFPMAKSSWA